MTLVADPDLDNVNAVLDMRGLLPRKVEIIKAIGDYPHTCQERQTWLRRLGQWKRGQYGPGQPHRLTPLSELVSLTESLIPRLHGFAAVAGVPRSGMVPASLLAIRLGLPLYAVRDGQVLPVGHGLRLHGLRAPNGPWLLVEDSANTGRSLRAAKQTVGHNCSTLAVISTPHAARQIDFVGRVQPMPHFFDWHWLQNSLIEKWGLDFDGVLCPDCDPRDDDDGQRYRNWLASVPRIRTTLPRQPAAIITARLEKYRDVTSRWLERHGIRPGKLVMGPWETIAQRHGQDIGRWKARQIRQLGLGGFIESDRRQADVIASLVDVPVLTW